MKPHVHIVAVAARTSVGLTAESSAAAIRAGISGVTEHPFMVDAGGEPVRCARDALLDASLPLTDRLFDLARHTLRELTQKLGSACIPGRELPVMLALPEERPGFGRHDAVRLIQALASDPLPGGGRLALHDVGRGHAGAFSGIERAVEQITRGQGEICLIGGVDGYLDADTLDWLDADGRLARADARGGFPPGEGAAMIALTSDGFRKQHGLPSLGGLRAIACRRETRDETSPEGLQGEALTEVLRELGAGLRPEERFEGFYCDINDERARTTDLAFALLRAGALFRDGTKYLTPVGNTGDIGAATAPLNCILAARAWARGYAPGENAIISGASWTGLRGAALLQETGR